MTDVEFSDMEYLIKKVARGRQKPREKLKAGKADAPVSNLLGKCNPMEDSEAIVDSIAIEGKVVDHALVESKGSRHEGPNGKTSLFQKNK